MANRDFPGGFEPKRRLGGGSAVVQYLPIATNNGAIGYYDLVERRADGFIHQAQASSTTIIGVAAEYKAANSGGTIAVYPAFDTIFEAQIDDATVDAQTDLDLNYDIAVGTIDSLTHRSGMEIDGSTQAATATLPIKILKISDDQTQDGNALGANVRVECLINQGVLKAGALG